MTTVSSQQIERTVTDDVIALLDAAEIASVIRESDTMPDTATAVVVRIVNMRGNLPGGTIPTGMRQADISVDVFSHRDDDHDGETLHELTGLVRAAIWRDDVIAELNTTSEYNRYYAMMSGDDLPDVDGRMRIIALQFSLVFRPSRET